MFLYTVCLVHVPVFTSTPSSHNDIIVEVVRVHKFTLIHFTILFQLNGSVNSIIISTSVLTYLPVIFLTLLIFSRISSLHELTRYTHVTHKHPISLSYVHNPNSLTKYTCLPTSAQPIIPLWTTDYLMFEAILIINKPTPSLSMPAIFEPQMILSGHAYPTGLYLIIAIVHDIHKPLSALKHCALYSCLAALTLSPLYSNLFLYFAIKVFTRTLTSPHTIIYENFSFLGTN